MSREWRKNNRERVRELNRQFYETNLEERKAYHRKYRQDHLEHMRAIGRKYRRENGEYFRDYMREWSRANPDKIQAKDHARRAFKMGRPGSFTIEEWQEMKQQYNYTCLRCGRREPEIKLTADHVVPISGVEQAQSTIYSRYANHAMLQSGTKRSTTDRTGNSKVEL